MLCGGVDDASDRVGRDQKDVAAAAATADGAVADAGVGATAGQEDAGGDDGRPRSAASSDRLAEIDSYGSWSRSST